MPTPLPLPPGGSSHATPLDREMVVAHAMDHRESMHTYAFGVLRNWAQAEDVVQEAFLVVDRRWEDWDGGEMWPWLCRIVKLKCYEALRRNRRRRKLNENSHLEELLKRDLDQSQNLERSESMRRRMAALQKCLEKLTPRARDLLHRFYVENEGGEKIAKDSDTPINTIWSYLHRSRQRLRKCIQRQLELTGETFDRDIELDGELDRLFSGEFSEKEKELLEAELEEAEPGCVAAYLEEWTVFATELRRNQETHGGVVLPFPGVSPRTIRRKQAAKRRRSRWAVAAAAVLVGASAFFLLPAGPDDGEIPELALGATRTASDDEPSAFRFGKAGTTKLKLRPGSEIRVIEEGGIGPDGLPAGGKVRLVNGFLSANVSPHSAGAPFSIATRTGLIEVIGTKFDVNLLREGVETVDVSQGQIRYSSSGKSVDVIAGELVVQYNKMAPYLIKREPVVRGFETLRWNFANSLDEMDGQLATFGTDVQREVSDTLQLVERDDVLIANAVEMPAAFEISGRLRLMPGLQKNRTILANSGTGIRVDGFRLGFDRSDEDQHSLRLRFNAGSGKDGGKVATAFGVVPIGEFFTFRVRVDADSVRSWIDGVEVAMKGKPYRGFKRTGPLYFGSQEPKRGAALLTGEMEWLQIESSD